MMDRNIAPSFYLCIHQGANQTSVVDERTEELRIAIESALTRVRLNESPSLCLVEKHMVLDETLSPIAKLEGLCLESLAVFLKHALVIFL